MPARPCDDGQVYIAAVDVRVLSNHTRLARESDKEGANENERDLI